MYKYSAVKTYTEQMTVEREKNDFVYYYEINNFKCYTVMKNDRISALRAF